MLHRFILTCRKRLAADYRLQVGLVIVAALAAVGAWRFSQRHIESTDNATLQCEMADVVSEVRGIIERIDFKDDQFVERGAQMVKIEDAVYRAQFERAAATLKVAETIQHNAGHVARVAELELHAEVKKSGALYAAASASVRAMHAGIAEARQELRAADIDVDFYRLSYERDRELNDYKAIAGREFENSQRTHFFRLAGRDALAARLVKQESQYASEQARAQQARIAHDTLVRAQADKLDTVRAQALLARDQAAVARADFDQASLNWARTVSRAKLSGTVTNRRLSAGEYIEVGQRIATIVACHDRPWVNANFKETQLAKMKPGQRARITIDSYPGVIFMGTLESISNGSGSTFSVLPPENATGNFTKVVKRMPVKIRLDGAQGQVLRVGSSVLVDVHLE